MTPKLKLKFWKTEKSAEGTLAVILLFVLQIIQSRMFLLLLSTYLLGDKFLPLIPDGVMLVA